ncbi:unnamed protein product [Caenorhabditis bovis]|uniref:Uncharacterized protein n=1 Tax=Caenorhabditis bovis TaxID=2654633 RepID=A0A8S1F9M7_9PELO|nr:unnamed protein product [Caenorhabditis bovis]
MPSTLAIDGAERPGWKFSSTRPAPDPRFRKYHAEGLMVGVGRLRQSKKRLKYRHTFVLLHNTTTSEARRGVRRALRASTSHFSAISRLDRARCASRCEPVAFCVFSMSLVIKTAPARRRRRRQLQFQEFHAAPKHI